MHKHRQVSKFQEYVNSRERKIKRALSEIEKRGAAAALDKCLVLAEQIDGDLGNKKLRQLFNNIFIAGRISGFNRARRLRARFNHDSDL